MQNGSIKKLVYSALFSTLIFIGTQFIKFPLVIGYFNVGDIFVLLAGWIIGGFGAMISAGISAGLADFLSGYAIYMPITVIIKAMMAFIAYIGYKLFAKKSAPIVIIGYVVSGIIAEVFMIFGYFLFDGFLYGFATASVAIIGNLIQGAISLVVSVLFICILDKIGILTQLRR